MTEPRRQPPTWSTLSEARRVLYPTDSATEILGRVIRRLSDEQLVHAIAHAKALDGGGPTGFEGLTDEQLRALREKVWTILEQDAAHG